MIEVHRLEDLNTAIGILYDKANESLTYGKPVVLSCERLKKTRSAQQNKFIHAIFKHIVEEYERTGWCFGNIAQKLGFVNEEIVKEYCKFRFDVKHTSNMSTKDCVEFTDKIQRECLEESKGQYERLDPPESLLGYSRELTMGHFRTDSFPHNSLVSHLHLQRG